MSEYRKVVQKLIDEARALGYHPVSVRDEEELYPATGMTTTEVVDTATATDSACLTFRNYSIGTDIFGARLSFYLVFGNQLHETINDFTDHGTAERIAAAVESAF